MSVDFIFFLKRLLCLICVKTFIIICVGCVGGSGQQFSLDSRVYDSGVLSFDRIGSYSMESFALAFSRSSVFKDTLSERDFKAVFVSSLFLSDYIQDAVTDFLKLKYSKAEGYRIEYMTADPYSDTETMRASGLVLAPSTSRSLPLLVYLHPTLFEKRHAPSLLPSALHSMDPVEDYRLMMIFLALQGYIVFAPDYVGYGASENKPHPYLHKKSVAQTTASLLRSAADALDEKGIPFQRDVFIMGYSQGGHGALAFAEALQNSSMNFKIQAVAAGGGPYDMLETVREHLDQKTLMRIFITQLLQSYAYIYNWNWDDIVRKTDYADIISSSFRHESLPKSTRGLPDRSDTLFRSQFVREITRRGREEDNLFQTSLKENNVYDWVPGFPVFLFHLKEDKFVPYENMEIAYRSFSSGIGRSVRKQDCSFRKVQDLVNIAKELNRKGGNTVSIRPDHINCSFIFFLEASDYFQDYRN